jgi:hypothetical protein
VSENHPRLLLSAALIALVIGSTTYAHDVTTHVTWNREISRIVFEKWVNGGAPEGNPDDLPTRPRVLLPPVVPPRAGELVAGDAFTFSRPFTLDGFWARNTSSREAQITVQFPDGHVEPLVWLRDYSAKYDHPFLLRKPLSVPVGAVLHGLPADASLVLLPATSH